jgi:hypothetical protein
MEVGVARHSPSSPCLSLLRQGGAAIPSVPMSSFRRNHHHQQMGEIGAGRAVSREERSWLGLPTGGRARWRGKVLCRTTKECHHNAMEQEEGQGLLAVRFHLSHCEGRGAKEEGSTLDRAVLRVVQGTGYMPAPPLLIATTRLDSCPPSTKLTSSSLRILLTNPRLKIPPPPSLLPRGVLVSNRTLSPVTFSLHITPSHPSDPRVFNFGKHRSGEHTIIHVPAMGSKEVILSP